MAESVYKSGLTIGRLPLEPLGDIAHFLVGRELKNIFEYRNKTVAELLTS